jgi:hypothetical protein
MIASRVAECLVLASAVAIGATQSQGREHVLDFLGTTPFPPWAPKRASAKAARWTQPLRGNRLPFPRYNAPVNVELIAAQRAEGRLWRDRPWFANVRADAHFAPFAAMWNLTGYPAAAIPAGRHLNGMPLSIQLIAPAGREASILSAAGQVETLRPWQRHANDEPMNR